MFLSIMGMYEYDNTVFNGLQIPEGIDRNALINNICLQCAELELIYPRIETMKIAITVWSVANLYTWDKLYKSMNFDYNPIWNVDANEIETEDNNRDITRNNTGSNNETIDLTDTESVKGFNSNSWSESNKVVHSGTDKTSITNNENINDDSTRSNTKRRTGNIGVTTTQKMIQEERDISEFSIINYITQSFKERFCILVY